MDNDRLAAIEEICKRLRETLKEFPSFDMSYATVVSPSPLGESVGGVRHLHSETIPCAMLCNAPYKISRFFEDVLV